MDVNQSPSQPGSRSRGRPRKKLSDDHRLNARREKNRTAQKLYRLRHLADEEAQRQEASRLEKRLNYAISIFLSLTDRVVQSEWATRDVLLMNELRTSVKDMLSLTKDSPDFASRLSGRRGNLERTLVNDDNVARRENVPSREAWSSQPRPSPSRSPKLEAFGLPVDYAGQYAERIFEVNIDLSASIIPQNFTPNPRRLDNPFSLQLTHLAIQHACHLLSTATSPTDDAVSRALGSRLKRHTRQEILHSLHWHLGPGYAQLDCLATPFFSPSITTQADVRLTDNRLYNADEIARNLRQRTRGLTNCDTLNVTVNIESSAKSSRTSKSIHPPNVPLPSVQNTNWHSNAENATIIKVSKLRLLQNISRSGTCFGTGPAFLGADVEQAILDSVIAPPTQAETEAGW